MTRIGLLTHQRRKILLLALLFSLPVIVAYGLYLSGWRPSSTGNHGDLIEPARPIADVVLASMNGKALRFSDLHGKWTMITFSASQCLKPCERNLYKMRQVAVAQGREADRVQTIFVVLDAAALDWLHYIIQDYPGMQVVTGPAAAVKSLARQFSLPAGTPLDNLNRIYLVDPLGNFMMSYPADADPTGLRKDLARLLRLSRIGRARATQENAYLFRARRTNPG